MPVWRVCSNLRIVVLLCVAFDCPLTSSLLPAHLRDANAFCYHLIWAIIPKNLLNYGDKVCTFSLIMQIFRRFSSKKKIISTFFCNFAASQASHADCGQKWSQVDRTGRVEQRHRWNPKANVAVCRAGRWEKDVFLTLLSV